MVIRFHKHRVFILTFAGIAFALFGVIIAFIASGDSKEERSVTLSYEIDTQKLSDEEISQVSEKFLLPNLQQLCGEMQVELSWRRVDQGIEVIACGTAEAIEKLKKTDSVVRLQVPAFFKVRELVQRQESSRKLQKLGQMLLQYREDSDDKLPDSLADLRKYDADDLLAWASENVAYLGKDMSSNNLSLPIAYDKRLLEKGIGTNVLFNDGAERFAKPTELESLGIIPKEQ